MKKLFQKELNKKGQVGLSSLPNAVLLMGLSAVIGIIMVVLIDQIGTSPSVAPAVNETNVAGNLTTAATSGIAEIFEQYDLIGLMIGLGVVLVVLVGVFGFLRFRQGGL